MLSIIEILMTKDGYKSKMSQSLPCEMYNYFIRGQATSSSFHQALTPFMIKYQDFALQPQYYSYVSLEHSEL